MKLADKILDLRKKHGMSQEELAEKLNVSRQAVSRWEGGSAQPDASNVLQLSLLFGVSADYILNDDYQPTQSMPQAPEISRKPDDNRQLAFIFLTGLNVMILINQIIACFVLQREIFSLVATMLSVAVVVGFEVAYHKAKPISQSAKKYRRKFYISALWLAAYFPIHLLATWAMRIYPRPYSSLIFEMAAFLVYVLFCAFATRLIRLKAV